MVSVSLFQYHRPAFPAAGLAAVVPDFGVQMNFGSVASAPGITPSIRRAVCRSAFHVRMTEAPSPLSAVAPSGTVLSHDMGQSFVHIITSRYFGVKATAAV